MRQVAGRNSGFCTEPHIACCVITQPPHSPDLASSDVSQPRRTSNRMRGSNSEDSKKSFPLELSTMVGSMEQVCVCAQESYFAGG
jgi:hypothetical protein